MTPKVYPSNPPVFNQPIADTWTGIDEIKPLVNKQSDHFEKDKKDEAGETDVGEQEEGGTSMEPTNSLNNMANINEAITDEIHEKDANAVNLVSTDQGILWRSITLNFIQIILSLSLMTDEIPSSIRFVLFIHFVSIFRSIFFSFEITCASSALVHTPNECKIHCNHVL